MTDELMMSWALHYAALGWPVFPLTTPVTFGPKEAEGDTPAATCSCGRSGCTNQGKHPRTSNGLSDATTDAQVIRAWWERWPDANIGLRTGVTFDVLDLDGWTALDVLDLAAPAGAATLTGPAVLTGKGVHYYQQPTGLGNRSGLVATGSGIDWRGTGGYVVAPPSLHMTGSWYDWAPGADWTTALPAVPDWLRHLVEHRRPAPGTKAAVARQLLKLDAPKQAAMSTVGRLSDATSAYGRRVLEHAAGEVRAAAEGARNATLNTSALVVGHYVAGGEIARSDAEAALTDAALAAGLGATEVQATVQSGLTAGMVDPKSAPKRQGVLA